ncbi:MAG TPA: hypothetical protein PLW72_05795, partial [Burkholderiaceae bacterium]|nr:hypothetical protein [Burkholderiaceae bacterium]
MRAGFLRAPGLPCARFHLQPPDQPPMDKLACSRPPMNRLRVLAPVPMLFAMALASSAGTAAELRGFASLGLKGLILFQPCEGRKLAPRTLKVEDATPEAALTAGIDDVRKIMLESGRPLYVEFRGDVAGLTATARQFQRALGTVATCDNAPTD